MKCFDCREEMKKTIQGKKQGHERKLRENQD